MSGLRSAVNSSVAVGGGKGLVDALVVKSPVSYYGGKAMLAGRIASIIEAVKVEYNLSSYVECFAGGASVFWRLPADLFRQGVLNDLNSEVANFWRVLSHADTAELLERQVKLSLHSRHAHERSALIYRYPHLFSEIDRAWAFWMQCNASFLSSPLNGFAFDRDMKSKRVLMNKADSFSADLHTRLRCFSIDCVSAVDCVRRYDSESAFIYCDPPYINTNCGHYSSYSEDDYRDLLGVLAAARGKFLLSGFPNPLLDEYRQKFNWWYLEIPMNSPAKQGKNVKSDTTKTEVRLWTIKG